MAALIGARHRHRSAALFIAWLGVALGFRRVAAALGSASAAALGGVSSRQRSWHRVAIIGGSVGVWRRSRPHSAAASWRRSAHRRKQLVSQHRHRRLIAWRRSSCGSARLGKRSASSARRRRQHRGGENNGLIGGLSAASAPRHHQQLGISSASAAALSSLAAAQAYLIGSGISGGVTAAAWRSARNKLTYRGGNVAKINVAALSALSSAASLAASAARRRNGASLASARRSSRARAHRSSA